jgi:WhiB family redox-sensing transcriptional regulator
MSTSEFPLRPAWAVAAACRDADPDLFFPESMEDAGPAKRVCAGCPVALECFRFALDTEQRWGVWAGTTPKQRTRLRTRLKGMGPEEVKELRPPGGQAAVNAQKTHCKNNHAFTEDNTARYKGRRICLTCHEDRAQQRRERRREARRSAS